MLWRQHDVLDEFRILGSDLSAIEPPKHGKLILMMNSIDQKACVVEFLREDVFIRVAFPFKPIRNCFCGFVLIELVNRTSGTLVGIALINERKALSFTKAFLYQGNCGQPLLPVHDIDAFIIFS